MKAKAWSTMAQLLAGGLLVAAGSLAVANGTDEIETSPHNLGSTGTGPNSFSGTTEICVFCHTPHGADNSASVPLWNRTLAAPSSYTTYDTLGTSTLEGQVAPVGSVSIACLSCHDGTQAMDAAINDPGMGDENAAFNAGVWTGAGTLPADEVVMLGTDLSNDHPIGIQYGGGGLTEATPAGVLNNVDFKATSNKSINNQTVWWVDTEATPDGARQKSDMQLYTRSVASIDGGAKQPFVECASCHDPHNNEYDLFLRISNDGSAVCLACHAK